MFNKLSTITDFFACYGNPFELAWKCLFAPHGVVRVVDRASGISCHCNFASYRMFREVWFDRDYDVPYLPIRKGDIVIDIGANQGFFALYAAHLGAQVYAFEPHKPSYETMLDNLQQNKLRERVKATCSAVAGQPGSVELICSNMLGGGMNTIQQNFASAMFNGQLEEKMVVECVTLPAIIQQHSLQKIRLCKLDCEGSELEIMRSLTREMAKCVDAFVLEFHPQAYDVEELVKLIMSWGTHQISFAEDKYCKREILRIISNEALLACSRISQS